MRVVVFERYGEPGAVRIVADPVPPVGGVVVRVEATGLCRSDWHGWMGHDPDITLPHVPGHELAGVVEAVGPGVSNWRAGDRVTVPFVCACGSCAECAAGQHQVCARQTQPGFTHWGSFAEYVALEHADVNLVAVPGELSYDTAAGLGCRFATAFRAVVAQGRVAPGEWVAVHGCGGVGLSAVMIAVAAGARVVAVDTAPEALELARAFGAAHCVDPRRGDAAEAVREYTRGGAHLSLDALGSAATAAASVAACAGAGGTCRSGCCPRRGVAALPMERVIGWELEILGSHGMAAHAYPPMMELVRSGALRPDLLVSSTIPLDGAPAALAAMGTAPGPGITIIRPGADARN